MTFKFDDDLAGMYKLGKERITKRENTPPVCVVKLDSDFTLSFFIKSGGGQFYVWETGHHFINQDAVDKHKKSRMYRRRCSFNFIFRITFSHF
jgi:hypothetical protein